MGDLLFDSNVLSIRNYSTQEIRAQLKQELQSVIVRCSVVLSLVYISKAGASKLLNLDGWHQSSVGAFPSKVRCHRCRFSVFDRVAVAHVQALGLKAIALLI